jgi:hypothetical protein
LRKSLDAFDERILDRRAHGARERHELRRVEPLIAEEDDLVLEECPANLLLGEIPPKVDAVDLGAEGSGDSADLYCSTLILALRMMLP